MIPQNLLQNCRKRLWQRGREETQVSKKINNNRRRFFGAAAMTIAAVLFGMIGSVNAPSRQITAEGATHGPAARGKCLWAFRGQKGNGLEVESSKPLLLN
jgi:hypothetical protein